MLKMFCLKLQCVGSRVNFHNFDGDLWPYDPIIWRCLLFCLYICVDLSNDDECLVFWGFTSLKLPVYFSHIAAWKQENTNLWNCRVEIGNRTLATCSTSQELNHYTTAAPHDNEGWTKNLCFFLSLSICSKKNQGVFVKHYSMPPAATKWKKLFLASRSKSRSQSHWPWCHLKGHH